MKRVRFNREEPVRSVEWFLRWWKRHWELFLIFLKRNSVNKRVAEVGEQEGASGCSCTLLSLSLSLFFSFSLSLSLRRNQMTEVADRKYFIMCHVLFAPRNALSMKINFIKRLSHWTIACARPSIERVCKCIVELQLIIEEFKAMSYIFFFFSFELDLFPSLFIPPAYDIFRLILKKPYCLISLLSKEGGLRYRSWNVNDVSFSHEHLKFHAANLLRVTDLHWLAS